MEQNQDIQSPLIPKKPPQQRSFISKLLFLYVYPLIKLANQKTLEYGMIPELEQKERSEYLFQKLQKNFQKYNKDSNGLLKSLFYTFLKQFIFTYATLFLYNGLLLYGPIMINQVLKYLTGSEQSIEKNCQWLGIIFVVRILNSISNQNSQYQLKKLGYDQQSAVSVYLMTKTVKVSFQSNKKYKIGEVMNLMTVDLNRILQFNQAMSQLFFIPIQIGVTYYLLYLYIGLSFLAGLGVLLLATFSNLILARAGMKAQKEIMAAKDARTKQAHEIFSNIKFIKANALEEFFRGKLDVARLKEIAKIKVRNFLGVFFVLTTHLTPQLILNASLAAYILTDHQLSAANIFSIISLFSILQQSTSQIAMIINQVMETNVSIKRIQTYLMTDEIMNDCIENNMDEQLALKINKGTFYWEFQNKEEKETKKTDILPINTPETIILKQINLEVKKSEFITIIGDVGCGKSSLFNAILGEMLYLKNEGQNENPQIFIYGSIAYVSQKSWIQNASVKDNILFGKQLDEEKYKEALKYSCLEQDLKILHNGDSTMIGEKGVNLSGGQKARISLARALYSDSDIYLLDDLISAVDMHVGKFIITECLCNYLKAKTIILITHALYACEYSSRTCLMENGEIVIEGPLQQIKNEDKFIKIYQKFFEQNENEDDSDKEEEKVIQIKKKKQSITIDETKSKDIVDDLMLLEDRKKGQISKEVFTSYLQLSGGGLMFVFSTLAVILQVCARFGAQIQLALWASEGELTNDENIHHLMIFSLFSLSTGFFAVLRTISLSHESINIAKKIHKMMIDALIYASQCQFFERMPLGVIMNRLTKDQSVLDLDLLWTMNIFFISMFNFVASNIINLYTSSFWIIIPILLFLYAVMKLQRYYMAANRELYRLESMSKSPILSFFSETVNGLQVIRSFNKVEKFINQHINNVNLNRTMQITQLQTNIWFSLNLTFMSFIVNYSAIAYVIVFGNNNPALTGMLFTVAVVIDNSLQSVVATIGQAETQFISFERCLALSKVEHEKGYQTQNQTVLMWPQKGQILIENLYVKYRETLAPALVGLNVSIQSKEKIGVVGRTGAGKSTITLSLLRILEAVNGRILIDGVDISTVGLQQLRSSITMILQDSVLFEGTIRENLDPQRLYEDQRLLQVAQLCCLGDILQQRNGLDTEIQENGENLSAGEKQLVAIARAVLKQSKIILIDEATANIDAETDHKIQQSIQSAFKDCTVITIAHRINTIMYCDKILVIDQGKAVEFDSPQALLQDSTSLFYNILQQGKRSKRPKAVIDNLYL